MSKMKWSFSLVVAFFLVGILSTAVFAKDPYSLLTSQTTDFGVKITFTNNTANGETAASVYDVTIKKSADNSVVKSWLGVTKGAYTATTADGISKDTLYNVELTYSGTVVSSMTTKVVDHHNTFNASYLDTTGSGLSNANHTGLDNTRKKKTNLDGKSQKIHGFYENNTNSCASCHQTHTGADNNLLMKNGAYSTCAACHDGTTAAKNVWSPITEDTVASVSGTFNYTLGHNSSIHEADGSLKVSAAPGGNNTAADSDNQWGQTFDCASCHSPHGNGSASENNLNLDPLGWGGVTWASTNSNTKNGRQFKNITIYDSPASVPVYNATSPAPADAPTYILVKTSAVDQAAVDGNYWWKRANVPAGSLILQTYKLNGSKGYVPDYSLWLREGGYPYTANTTLYSDLWANLKMNSQKVDPTKDITSTMTVVWKDGFAYGDGVANVKSAQVSIGIDVETTGNIRSLFDSSFNDGNGNAYIPDSGVEMSKYCSACHTDYLSATRNDTTGLFTSAHRHQTATDSLTCVRCHFGHGSDAQIMKDANDNTYYDLTTAVGTPNPTTGHMGSGLSSADALNYLTDINPSSALKRYTGMSVCYACHGQGEQFAGNANNNPNANKTNNGNVLLPGQPGTR